MIIRRPEHNLRDLWEMHLILFYYNRWNISRRKCPVTLEFNVNVKNRPEKMKNGRIFFAKGFKFYSKFLNFKFSGVIILKKKKPIIFSSSKCIN